MLKLDLNRLMELREIQDPRKFLVKSGFTYHAAGRLLQNEISGTNNIERLCIVLNCTPDDLFNWTPPRDLRNPKKHALNKLAGRKSNGRIVDKVKDLPEQKLHALHEFLDKLAGTE